MRDKYFVFFCLFWIAVSCDVLELSEIPDYPIRIEPLGLLELDDLNRQYQDENEYVCSTLNEYGFTGYSRILFPNDINPCSSKETIRIELSNPDTLISKAREAVIKNYEYTNVTNSTALTTEEVLPLYGCTICEGPATNSVPLEWKITFSSQIVEGLEVQNSEISVFVDAIGVNRIWGNWIPDFYAPGLLDVGYLEAESKVIGSFLELNGITGQDSSFVVSEEHLLQPSKLSIFPFLNDMGQLELRKTWKVTVDYIYEDIDGIFAHVDAVDGVLLDFVVAQENEEN